MSLHISLHAALIHHLPSAFAIRQSVCSFEVEGAQGNRPEDYGRQEGRQGVLPLGVHHQGALEYGAEQMLQFKHEIGWPVKCTGFVRDGKCLRCGIDVLGIAAYDFKMIIADLDDE